MYGNKSKEYKKIKKIVSNALPGYTCSIRGGAGIVNSDIDTLVNFKQNNLLLQ